MTVTNVYSSQTAKDIRERARVVGYDFQTTLQLSSGGHEQLALNQVGIELGINNIDGPKNLLFTQYLKSDNDSNNFMFQGNDGMLYNLNFTSGAIKTQSETDFAIENGLINEKGKFYDIISFGTDSAKFINYEFTGAGDGDFKPATVNLANREWGNINWVYQEVDETAIGSTDGTSAAKVANEAFDTILKYSHQWLSATAYRELEECDTYEERMEKFRELMIEALDDVGAKTSDFQAQG